MTQKKKLLQRLGNKNNYSDAEEEAVATIRDCADPFGGVQGRDRQSKFRVASLQEARESKSRTKRNPRPLQTHSKFYESTPYILRVLCKLIPSSMNLYDFACQLIYKFHECESTSPCYYNINIYHMLYLYVPNFLK